MSNYAQKDVHGVFILSCSDLRLNPYSILGVDPERELKAITIRNAGGRAFDAIRSLAVLGKLGNPRVIVVMHHTDCGMTHFRDADIKHHLCTISPEGGEEIEGIKRYGEIIGTIEESIKEDVALLRTSPFVKTGTVIVGAKYDVFSGQLKERERWTR